MPATKHISQFYDASRRLLRTVPGFAGLGVGYVKGRNGGKPSFGWRLYLNSGNDSGLPKQLFGYDIHVIKKTPTTLCYGHEHEEILRPGIKIISRADPAGGTLGCFVRSNVDSSKVFILSNSHVLLGDINSARPVSTGVGGKVGQPENACCCCYQDRTIGKVETGGELSLNEVFVEVPHDENGEGDPYIDTGSETDCALSSWNGTRAFSNNSTKEGSPNYGMIKGTPSAEEGLGIIAGSVVEKVGSRTGHTKGVVLPINFTGTRVEDPDEDGIFTSIGAVEDILYPYGVGGDDSDQFAGAFRNINFFLVMPTDNDPLNPNQSTLNFVMEGDSGSVVVNSERKVVGQVIREWRVDRDHWREEVEAFTGETIPKNVERLGIVGIIGPVLDLLNVHIVSDDEGAATASGKLLEVPITAAFEQRQKDLRRFSQMDQLRRELGQNKNSKSYLDSILQYRDEVMELVNHKRQVMVVWNRNEGPGWFTHLMKSLEDKSYQLPDAVKGKSILHLMEQMKAILTIYGSDALISAINQLPRKPNELFSELNSIWDLIERLKEPSSLNAT